MESPQLAFRYLAKFSVFLIDSMIALSTSFWSADLASGNASFSLGLPSEKNSSSAEVDAFFAAKDVLKMQLDGHRHATPVDMDAVAAVRARLEALSSGHATAAPPAPQQAAAARRRLNLDLPALPQDDLDALLGELDLMGTVSSQPLDGGCLRLCVDTDQSAGAQQLVKTATESASSLASSAFA